MAADHDMTHKCPAVGCTRRVVPNQLACRDDWYRLPTGLRRQIYRAYYGPGPGSSMHNTALDAAIEWYRDNP